MLLNPRILLFLSALLLPGLWAISASAQTVKTQELSRADVPPSIAQNLAQNLMVPAAAPNYAIFRPQLSIGYTTIGAGFNQSVNFSGFAPLLQTPGKSLTFLEGKLLVDTDSGTLGGNILLGHRFLSDSKTAIVGGYVAYDTRNTGDATFHQLGGGFAVLSKNWDFQTNAYLPLGNSSVQLAETFSGSSYFQGNSLLLNNTRVFQAALSGVDAEVGTRLLAWSGGGLRSYAGGYVYSGEGIPSFVGVRGRLVGTWQGLTAGLTVQHDPRFDTRLVFNISATLGGNHAATNQPETLASRVGEGFQRETTILVDNQTEQVTSAAINPVTGQPWVFQHANIGIGTGSGTFENPTGTVAAALSNTLTDGNGIVYVNAGKNSGIPAFTVPTKVQVLSTGPVQPINTSQAGLVQLPGSGTGVNPKVTGTITLASNGVNQVLSGFAVTNPTSGLPGIVGNNNINTSILNNQVIIPLSAPNNATSQALGLTANRGIVLVGANSTANGQTTIDNNTVNNAIGEGIRLENVNGKAFITNNTVLNTIQPYNQTGLEGSIFVRNNKGDVDLTIANNTVGDNNTRSTTGYSSVIGSGVYTNGPLVGNEIDGIEFSLCRSYAGGLPDTFAQCSGTATAKVTIANNIVRNIGTLGVDGADGIDINLNNGDVDLLPDKGARVSSLTISGNTITNIADKGVSFGSDGDTVLGLGTVTNNTVTNVGGIGIALRARQTSNTNYVATNNTVTKAAANGIEYSETRTDNSAISTGVIDGNTIKDSGPDGIFVRTRINGQAKATITNNTINNSGLTSGTTIGIEVSAEENSKLQVLLSGNTITGNRAEGILIRDNATAAGGVNAGNAQLNGVVKNNTITGNNTATTAGSGAFTARANSNANLCLQLQKNTAGLTLATGYVLNRAVTTATAVPIFRIEDSLLTTNIGLFTPSLPLPTGASTAIGTNNFVSVAASTCGTAFGQ